LIALLLAHIIIAYIRLIGVTKAPRASGACASATVDDRSSRRLPPAAGGAEFALTFTFMNRQQPLFPAGVAPSR